MRPQLCPSIVPVLEILRGSGKLLGVASGNLERIGWLKLEAAGLRPYFSFGSFSDQNELREDIFRHGMAEVQRRLGPGATVYVVGDTPADVRAAKAVGIPVIALATGTFLLAQLLELAPDACFPCGDDLLRCQ
jgi:phosphoglycolate phosphatase-like HAD superfamily hydrolase